MAIGIRALDEEDADTLALAPSIKQPNMMLNVPLASAPGEHTGLT